MLRTLCNIIIAVIGVLIVISFIFFIFILLTSNDICSHWFGQAWPKLMPATAIPAPPGHDDFVLKQAAFVLQFVSWIFTIGAFAFTALGFFGLKKIDSLGKTEQRIERKFSELQKEHAALKEREANEFEFTTARIFYFKGHYSDALEILNGLHLDTAEVDLYKGFVLTQLGDNQEALKHFENALKAPNVNKSRVYHNIGKCWLKSKVYDKAIDYFDRAIAEKGSLSEAYIDKAIALRRSGELKRAVEVLTGVIKLSPNNPRANYNLACYYALLNDAQWEKYLNIVVGLNGVKYIKMADSDTDFASIRETDKFKKIISQSSFE